MTKKITLIISINIWLFIAIVLMIGRITVSTDPTQYAFFEIGAHLSPFMYNGMIISSVFIAFLQLGAYSEKKEKKHNEPEEEFTSTTHETFQ